MRLSAVIREFRHIKTARHKAHAGYQEFPGSRIIRRYASGVENLGKLRKITMAKGYFVEGAGAPPLRVGQ
jgi:hypothetical protein